jgi:hypothetical protein
MKRQPSEVLVALARLAVAAPILAAIIATHAEAASRTSVNIFNLYGYFTVQSNLIGVVSLTASAIAVLTRHSDGRALTLVRALATTCLAIVGIVYATLLAPLGAAGGVPLLWANVMLHIVSPIAVVLDWLLVGDRARLPLTRLWLILLYPAAWTAVVLVRGATDGWVPYPFLDPGLGYATVALYCLAILVAFTGIGLLTLWASRTRGVILLQPLAPTPPGPSS